jgi:hypothetical protein
MNAAERLETLASIEHACWRQLSAATQDGAHEWRVMALATVEDGQAQARSVVIRDVSPDERALIFYTDARSPKVAQVNSQPQATLLAWSRSLSWQLRLRVALEVQTNGLEVSSRWAQLKLTPGAQDYLSPLPPGTPIERPSATPERSSREHFAVVCAQVVSLDWLELHAQGHRRAMFDASGARWLQP